MAHRNSSELARKLVAEGLGTAFLLATVVGSGIMAERLAEGNSAVALLANAIATGAGLIALILVFGPVSGAHFNPVVTLAGAMMRAISWKLVPGYVIMQILGAFVGVGIANIMFELPVFFVSDHVRAGAGQYFSEFVATFGLLSVILSCARHYPTWVPAAVGAYITAAYWFTSSTSFANPAVTLARTISDTFAGIYPGNVPAFIIAQLAGMTGAVVFFRWLMPAPADNPTTNYQPSVEHNRE